MTETAVREIQTPGEAPASGGAAATAADAPQRRKPGPKSKAEREAAAAAAASAADDDLEQYEGEELPPVVTAAIPRGPASMFTAEQQQVIAAMIAQAVHASKSSQDPNTAARLAAAAGSVERLPSQDEARVMCENAVAQGIRPRAIHTRDGWYVHPEMTRVKDHGVAKLKLGEE